MTDSWLDFSDLKSSECINIAFQEANIDPAVVDECISSSGGLDSGNNKYLDDLLSRLDVMGFRVPSLFVNHQTVSYTANTWEIFELICASYAPGFEPSICHECTTEDGFALLDLDDCIEEAQRSRQERRFVSVITIAIVLGCWGLQYAAHYFHILRVVRSELQMHGLIATTATTVRHERNKKTSNDRFEIVDTEDEVDKNGPLHELS